MQAAHWSWPVPCGLCCTLAFLLGAWNFGTRWIEGISVTSPKCSTNLSLNELPWAEALRTCCCIFLAGGRDCVAPREGERTKRPAHGFLQTLLGLVLLGPSSQATPTVSP